MHDNIAMIEGCEVTGRLVEKRKKKRESCVKRTRSNKEMTAYSYNVMYTHKMVIKMIQT